jgi:hypothetical protein
MSTLAAFRERIPEFVSVPDAFVEVALAEAIATQTATGWGNAYSYAMIYLAAHSIALDPTYGSGVSVSGGPVTSKRAGDLAESYGAMQAANLSVGDQDLALTSYGRAYLRLRNSRAEFGMRVTSTSVL